VISVVAKIQDDIVAQGITLEQLRGISRECQAFEHVIAAMGYGYSFLNVSEKDFEARCDYCVHWQDSHCDIFRGELGQWRSNH
jgi:hypothetical protein